MIREGVDTRRVLSRFREVSQDPLAWGKRLKNRDPKVVGCIGLWIPEELVHATGMVPIIIPGGSSAPSNGDATLAPFFCAYARRVVAMAERGDLAFLEGLVIEVCCNAYKAASWVIQQRAPSVAKQLVIGPPLALEKPRARQFMAQELRDLWAGLQELSGRQVSTAQIGDSIRLYNRWRQQLKKLYGIRRHHPGVITAREMMDIIISATVMRKEDHLGLLEELLASLAENTAHRGGASGSTLRIILSGSLCEPPPTEVLEQLEELGAAVVDDDLYSGSRYFLTEVNESEQVDPFEALADAYVQMRAPCPTRYHSRNGIWGDYLVDMAKLANADGVIDVVCQFCEPHVAHYPLVRKRLEAADIPELRLESAYEAVAEGQTRTRLEAFLELLQARRGGS